MSAFGGKADSTRRRTHGLILTGHAMTSAALRIRWQAANKMGADATVPSGQQAPSLLKWGVALGHSEWAYGYHQRSCLGLPRKPRSNTAAVAVRAHTSLVIALQHRSPVFCAGSPPVDGFRKSPAQMNLVPDHPIKCMACMRRDVSCAEHAKSLISLGSASMG